MRSRLGALVYVSVFGLVLAGCSNGDTATPDADTWPTFTDPSMGISFKLPADPESLTQRVRLPDGTTTDLVIHRHSDGDTELIVSTFLVDPDQFDLDAAASGAADAVDGYVVSLQSHDVDGFTGRHAEIHFERDGSAQVMLHRAVLFDTGVVQLQASGSRSARDELVTLHDVLVDGVSPP